MKKFFGLFVLLAMCCFVVTGCESGDSSSSDGGSSTTESTDDGSSESDAEDDGSDHSQFKLRSTYEVV